MAKKAWGLADRGQLHKDADKGLDQNLLPGEAVRVVVRGEHNSAMVGTDRRVFVFKRGAVSGAMFGSKLASWDYANVTGVQLETGFASGVALIQAAGVAAADVSAYGTGKDSAARAPNALVLGAGHFEQARQGVAELRRLVAEHQAARNSETTAVAPGALDQLRQLGELRDAGVVTAAEFEAKKADLLARL